MQRVGLERKREAEAERSIQPDVYRDNSAGGRRHGRGHRPAQAHELLDDAHRREPTRDGHPNVRPDER